MWHICSFVSPWIHPHVFLLVFHQLLPPTFFRGTNIFNWRCNTLQHTDSAESRNLSMSVSPSKTPVCSLDKQTCRRLMHYDLPGRGSEVGKFCSEYVQGPPDYVILNRLLLNRADPQNLSNESLTAANWVSFDFNVAYSSRWGYSLINTLKLKRDCTARCVYHKGKTFVVYHKATDAFPCGIFYHKPFA